MPGLAPNICTYHAFIAATSGAAQWMWCITIPGTAVFSMSSTFVSSGPRTNASLPPVALVAMSSLTGIVEGASPAVAIGKPVAFSLSIAARRLGTSKPT